MGFREGFNYCTSEITSVNQQLDPGHWPSERTTVDIAPAETFYPHCLTSEKPIVTEKLNPGECIGYFGEMEVVIVRMNTGPECRQVIEMVDPMEKAIFAKSFR